MGVFTIYNCGTSYDETKNELIAKLFARTQGVRGRDKLICAGPGSTLMTRPGYDPAKAPGDYKFSSTPWGGVYQGIGELSGGISGVKQVQFNVDRVMEILKGLPHPKPFMINMAGWSRGACTCHAMANAMRRDHDGWLSSVPVNIIAVDPVPGTGNLHLKDWETVPGNVANYEAIFMENENRAIMYAAQLNFESKETKRTLLHMPGKHWFAVEADDEVMSAGLVEVERVGGHLVSEFLETWGTQFQQGQSMKRTDTELLEDYALMIEHTKDFFKNGGDKIYRWTGNNHTWFKMPNHLLSSSPYFVNVHHKQVFKRIAPKIFKYFFVHQIFDESTPFMVYLGNAMKDLADDPWVLEGLMTELGTLSGMAPHTFETLRDFAGFVEKPRAKVLQLQKSQPKYSKHQNSFGEIFGKVA